MGKPLSTLYLYLTVEYDAKLTKTWEKWRVDIPSLEEEEWKECLISYIPSMIAAKDRFIQFKFLHRAYFTPQRLARIYLQRDPNCQRCRQEVGTFWHMVWSCPKLRLFWSAVASTLSNVIGSNLPMDPQILLLSHLEDVEGDRYSKLCLTFALYYARREILLRWKMVEPPTLASWIRSVNKGTPPV